LRNENNLSNRLSNEELEELVDILDTFPSENAMNLEMLDGFFTALGCCPRVILPSQFMHMIFGNKEDGAAPFNDIKEYERFFSLLMNHWNSVMANLQNDRFEPVFEDIEEDFGMLWASGFLMGVSLSGEEFDKIASDEEKWPFLFPILALAYDGSYDDSDLNILDKEMTPDARKEMADALSESIPAIYSILRNQEVFIGTTKIGRNDPCPCGSCKKYKKCCLRDFVLKIYLSLY